MNNTISIKTYGFNMEQMFCINTDSVTDIFEYDDNGTIRIHLANGVLYIISLVVYKINNIEWAEISTADKNEMISMIRAYRRSVITDVMNGVSVSIDGQRFIDSTDNAFEHLDFKIKVDCYRK